MGEAAPTVVEKKDTSTEETQFIIGVVIAVVLGLVFLTWVSFIIYRSCIKKPPPQLPVTKRQVNQGVAIGAIVDEESQKEDQRLVHEDLMTVTQVDSKGPGQDLNFNCPNPQSTQHSASPRHNGAPKPPTPKQYEEEPEAHSKYITFQPKELAGSDFLEKKPVMAEKQFLIHEQETQPPAGRQENQVPTTEHIQTPNLEDLLFSEHQPTPGRPSDNDATCAEDVGNSTAELEAVNFRKPTVKSIGAAVHGKQPKTMR